MEKDALIKKVTNMEFGDCFGLNFDDKYCTYISKTRWIDNCCYIIGGADDETIAKSIYGNDEEVATELINGIFIGWKFAEDIEIKITDKSAISVTRKGGDIFRSGQFDNFVAIKQR